MTSTADTLVPEPLWQAIQPLLPTPPRRYGDRLAGTRGPVPGRRDGVRDARGATRYDTNAGRGLMRGAVSWSTCRVGRVESAVTLHRGLR